MIVAIVIVNKKTKNRVIKKFKDPKELREFWELSKKKYGQNSWMYTVNCTKPSPPKYTYEGTWCPYCNNGREFYFDLRLEVKRCPVCGISDHDYYVDKYMHIGIDQ
jgi:hypothetical protein